MKILMIGVENGKEYPLVTRSSKLFQYDRNSYIGLNRNLKLSESLGYNSFFLISFSVILSKNTSMLKGIKTTNV